MTVIDVNEDDELSFAYAIEGLTDPGEEPDTPAPAPTYADNVLAQYHALTDPSRAWAIALCKTSGGLAFHDTSADVEFWVFRDGSVIDMAREGGLRPGVGREDQSEGHRKRIWL